MKKFIKPLVIAASVAAIAGIGAVSFAKWQAGNNSETVESNSTGEISVLEFDTTVPAAVTELLPIDQEDDAQYKSVTFEIITSDAYEYSDFKLNIKIDNIKDSAGDTATFTDGIYVSKDHPASTTPTGTKVTAEGVDITYDIADGAYTLYIWLQSDDNTEMNYSFDLVYSLADGTTAA